MMTTERGVLVSTDATCIIRGNVASSVLTLVWKDGIDSHASDYFRHLHLSEQVVQSSIWEYAKIIRAFLAFARLHGMTLERMTDDFLTKWRDWRRAQPNVADRRVNDCLGCVFQFLKWLEESRRIRHVVGIYAPGEANGIPDGHVFPVGALLKLRGPPGGPVRREWTTELFLGGVGSAESDRHTPVDDEIRRVHIALLRKRHGVRDALAHSWAEETGARRAELLSIDVGQIPDDDRLAQLMERDEQYAIKVIRKNKASGAMIYPTIDLLIRTRDYIDTERAIVVARAEARIPGYVNPAALFISGQTGERLSPNALTKLSGNAFQEACVEKASLHRLRGTFAHNALDALLDAVFLQDDLPNMGSWTETIITKLMELMGHASAESLTPYIQFALRKRLKTSVAARAQDAERRLRNAELAYEGLVVKLKPIKILYEMAIAIQGDHSQDIRRLRDEFETELTFLAAE